MKKRLNLICLGIVLAVLVSMSFLFSTFYYGFKAGIDAYEQGAAGVEKLDVTYKMIGTMPTDVITNETATAINEKDGSTVSILPFISMIGIPNEKADATDSIFLSLLIAGLDGDNMLHLCHSPIRQNDSEHPPQHHFRLDERETPAPVGLFAYPLFLLLVGDVRHQQSFGLSSDKFEGL